MKFFDYEPIWIQIKEHVLKLISNKGLLICIQTGPIMQRSFFNFRYDVLISWMSSFLLYEGYRSSISVALYWRSYLIQINVYVALFHLTKTGTWKPWARSNWITSAPIFFIVLLVPVLFEKHFKASSNVASSVQLFVLRVRTEGCNFVLTKVVNSRDYETVWWILIWI